ncbi:KAP family P-loop NTPase fold protein [Psychrobacter piscatorii]|uniref:KAP family P-loop NTPase fold protein n=1 Tax=Psychrobacter piscatorii TaxID=554343 RepID=UPI00191A1FDA|nr:P-loop NTPase fold protein [Psychrobacter piscatorii]
MTDHSVMRELTFTSRDEFIREPIAEKIIKLLDSAIDVSPLIIDGKWGTGKTEFCFKLKNLIEAHNTNDYKVGYVNAFQADHANEPLLTLIAEVAGFYGEDDDKRKSFIKNAIPYLRLVSGIGIKAIASLAFGKYAADMSDDFKEGMEAIEEGSDSFIDQSLESMIKDQVEAEKNLSTLKEALKDIASINPVILLIDELDRCRPDFAVMMLETIKHVFDVENVQIILITNAEQLKATIKHSYGSETNSHDYLYKFFKYQINLPTSTKDIEGRSVENNVTYFKATVQASKVIPQDFKDNQFMYEIPTFLDVGKLSLRNIEQIVRCIETLIIFEDKEQSKSRIVEQILMVFLSFVYMMDKDLLKQIIKRSINSDKFLGFTNNSRLNMTSSYVRSETLADLSVKHLFLIIFEKIFTSSFLDLPISTIDRKSVMARIGVSLSKYDYIDDVHCDSYIKQTINNLLLFDIVK